MSTLILWNLRIFFFENLWIKKTFLISVQETKWLKWSMIGQLDSSNFRLRVSRTIFYQLRGLPWCFFTGFFFRLALFEVLKNSPWIFLKTYLFKSKIKLQASPYTGHKSSRSIETIHMNEIRSESYGSWISHGWWVTDDPNSPWVMTSVNSLKIEKK